jgi:plasmid maintenance system antidote protein VapI
MKFERVNIGELIKEKVMEKDNSLASFGKSIGVQRQNLEKTIFGKRSIDTEMLSLISETLGFNFFQYYRNMDECNINDYEQNKLTEVTALITLQVGQEKKEEKFTFSFKRDEK